jgi:hypothetical protein
VRVAHSEADGWVGEAGGGPERPESTKTSGCRRRELANLGVEAGHSGKYHVVVSCI